MKANLLYMILTQDIHFSIMNSSDDSPSLALFPSLQPAIVTRTARSYPIYPTILPIFSVPDTLQIERPNNFEEGVDISPPSITLTSAPFSDTSPWGSTDIDYSHGPP